MDIIIEINTTTDINNDINIHNFGYPRIILFYFIFAFRKSEKCCCYDIFLNR